MGPVPSRSPGHRVRAATPRLLAAALVPLACLTMACGGDAGGESPEDDSARARAAASERAAPGDAAPAEVAPGPAAAAPGRWIDLFNGRDLTGWTPKITGAPTGEDPWDTFRVEDGLLTVGYEGYDDFGGRFGHLFYQTPYAHYRLQVEYRFVGEQVAGGPGWAFRNSGVMFHSQSPGSMLPDQDFPISLEAQFLGGNGVDERPTANLCTPGTHVEMDGTLVEAHCVESTSPTFHGDGWVTVELVVRGGDSVVHLVNGDTVLAYRRPVIGGGEVHGHDPAAKPDGQLLESGYLALQSESHPIQFRTVRLEPLDPGSDG